MATVQTRFWDIRIDGRRIASQADMEPRYAVQCDWETQPVDESGNVIENADQVVQTGYVLYEREADAESAASGSIPHIAALHETGQRMIMGTDIENRQVKQVDQSAEIQKGPFEALADAMQSEITNAGSFDVQGSNVCYGIGTKKLVDEMVAKDEELRSAGMDDQEIKGMLLI